MMGPQPRRVSGVPLEPGERVLYFRAVDHTGARIARIFVGLLLAPIIIGLVLLYAVYSDWMTEPDAQAITNRRLLSMKRDGKILVAMRWEEITGFTKVLHRAADATLGVNDATGPKLHFAEDGPRLQQVLPMWRENPAAREQAPEVTFL